MTYPITPNPAIHVQPANIGAQQMLFTAGQLQTWAEELPLAMTLDLMDAILKSLGVSQAEITALNNDATSFYNAIQTWLSQTNTAAQTAWNNWVATLNNLDQATIADFTTWLSNAQTDATNAWTQLEAFFTTGDWSDLSTAMQDIFQAIFGSSTSLGLVGGIPAPAVINVTQNLQPVWDFPDAAALAGTGSQWSWDGTQDHTGVAGSGSAKVVANGVLQALRGIPGAVQGGQVVAPTAWVMWSGLTYSGSDPVQLQLIPYSQSGSVLSAGTPVVVAQLATPASSGSWIELTGTYTVPSSGVAAVQSRLVIPGTVSAGSVWWDDCQVDVTGGYLATLQNDLTTLSDDFTAGNTAFGTFLTTVEADITGYTSWSTFITNVESAWNTYTTTVSGLVSSEIFTVQQFFNTMLGLNASTGQISNTNIGNVLGGGSLGADVQAILDYIANALGHSGTGHTLTQIETYLGLIPATNVTNVLGGGSLGADVQAILDYIANALGHSGTGHTLTNIETYLGLIPPANVTNVLGGANLGADVSAVSTTAANGTSWATRLTNDLTILLDVFHITYTSTQWNNAWSDLMVLLGIVNSTSTPTNPTPTIGTSITAAQSSATTAGTNASTAIANAATAQTTLNTTNTNLFGSTTPGTAILTGAVPSGIAATKITNVLGGANLGADVSSVHTTASNASTWSTRLTNDLLVLSDVFHLTYAVGTSTDPPGTLSGGKPTWYSCWNDLLSLTGLVNAVTAPTDTAPTTGTVIQANTAAATTAGTNASIAISSASSANTLAQGTVDGLYQAFNGGASTGNAVSTVKAGATAIPASNIVGGTGAAVTFGAVGAGNGTNLASTSGTLSWSHTIATGDLGVVVVFAYELQSGTATTSVTYGGTAMTLLQKQVSSVSAGFDYATIEAWWLKAPASGAKTVTVSVSGPSFQGIAGNSVSYAASKTGTVGPNTGGGSASLSMSAASTTNNMVLGAFASVLSSSTPALSAYNKTSRYNASITGIALVIGDAVGASSVAYSATSSVPSGYSASNVQWSGITVELSN